MNKLLVILACFSFLAAVLASEHADRDVAEFLSDEAELDLDSHTSSGHHGKSAGARRPCEGLIRGGVISKAVCDCFSSRGVLTWNNGQCLVTASTLEKITKVMVKRNPGARHPTWEIRGRCVDEHGKLWFKTGNPPKRCLNYLGTVECPCHETNGKKMSASEAHDSIRKQLDRVGDYSRGPISGLMNKQKNVHATHLMTKCWESVCKAQGLEDMDAAWGSTDKTETADTMKRFNKLDRKSSSTSDVVSADAQLSDLLTNEDSSKTNEGAGWDCG